MIRLAPRVKWRRDTLCSAISRSAYSSLINLADEEDREGGRPRRPVVVALDQTMTKGSQRSELQKLEGVTLVPSRTGASLPDIEALKNTYDCSTAVYLNESKLGSGEDWDSPAKTYPVEGADVTLNSAVADANALLSLYSLNSNRRGTRGKPQTSGTQEVTVEMLYPSSMRFLKTGECQTSIVWTMHLLIRPMALYRFEPQQERGRQEEIREGME